MSNSKTEAVKVSKPLVVALIGLGALLLCVLTLQFLDDDLDRIKKEADKRLSKTTSATEIGEIYVWAAVHEDPGGSHCFEEISEGIESHKVQKQYLNALDKYFSFEGYLCSRERRQFLRGLATAN